MNNSNVSFTSKIVFIDGKTFFKNKNKGQYIGYTHTEPNMLKCPNFHSEAIRTCTGGGIVNDGKKEALGFHFWDDKTNKKNFIDIVVKLFRWMPEGNRGILIGSKDLKGNDYSVEQFQRFKEVFLRRLDAVTLFEKHKNQSSETNYQYSKDTDTWTLATSYVDKNGKYKYIKTIKDLREAYENIKIADGDTLILNNKVVTPKDAPDFF